MIAIKPVKTLSSQARGLASLLSIGAISALVAASPVQALSINLLTAPLVSPAAAWTYYGSATTHTPGALAWSSASRPIEIKEVARALGAGRYSADAYAQAVYEYVRNNIEMDFRFGLSKGARGAIIDQSGTSFDQAHLMVELLREGNVAASYQVGTITLNGTQFTNWSGYTNAQAACQFLADGGIPAMVNGASSCSGLSGAVSTVVVGHIWVSANSKLYDPSYKQHILKTGTDLAAAMGCGTSSAPTCGSTVLGFMPAATITSGVSRIQGSSALQSSIDNQVKAYGTNLQNWIQSYNATNRTSMQVEDLIGGRIIDSGAAFNIQSTGSPLPYTLTVQYSWPGDIPNQYRTTLQVQFDNINQPLYVDEVYGSRLRLWGHADNSSASTTTRHMALYAEYRPLARSDLANAARQATLTLSVNHPYSANGGSYADEVQAQQAPIQANGCDFSVAGSCSSDGWYIGVMTLVQGWGKATQSTISHVGALQRRDVTNTTAENPSDPKHVWVARTYYPGVVDFCLPAAVPSSTVHDPGCYEQHQPSIAATWLAESTRVNDLVAQVNQSGVQTHHSLGYVISGRSLGSGMFINAQTSLSSSSFTSNATDRQVAVNTVAAVSSRLEASVLEQMQDAWEGGSSVSYLAKSNAKGYAFLEINSLNQTAALAQLSNYSTAMRSSIQSYVAAGYTVNAPTNGQLGSYSFASGGSVITYLVNGALATTPGGDRLAYLTAGYQNGAGSALATDPGSAALNAVKLMDQSVKDKKYYGVNLQAGSLALTPPPDLVTGTKAFPNSLAYQRYYDSAEAIDAYDCTGQSTCVPLTEPRPTVEYRLADLGGGWRHNFSIMARSGSDALAGLGRDAAIHGAGAIAGLYVLRSLNAAPVDFRRRLATVFATDGWARNLQDNVVTVERPPNTTVFVRSMDGLTFHSPPGSAERLIQTGARYLAAFGDNGAALWNAGGVSFSLTSADGSTLGFMYGGVNGNVYQNFFVPTAWQFPDGVRVSFSYTTPNNFYRCLAGVSNSLGRSLSFPCSTSEFAGSWVQDENSRRVTFSSDTYVLAGLNQAAFDRPKTLYVTAVDGGITRYDYIQNPFTAVQRGYHKIYRWFTPDDATTPFVTADYDSLYRVKALIDKSGNRTDYFSAGLYGTENQKRGEMKDPLNALTRSYFDKNNNLLSITDALNRTTYNTYDSARRLTKTAYPERNSVDYTYDARHNRLTETQVPKPGSGWPTLTTTTTYVEAPTIAACTNHATCNKPVSINGPRTDVTDITTYAYNTNGTIARVVGPAVTGGNAQTDFCYTPTTGTTGSISLLTGKIEKVSASANRVTSYVYNTASPATNHLVLQSATTDPSTTLVPPASAGGSCTTVAKSGAFALRTAFTFDGAGNVQTINGPRPDTPAADLTTYSSDKMRRLTKVVAPLGAVTRHCYTVDGLLASTHRARSTSATDPNATTATTTGLCASAYDPVQWASETRTYHPTGDLKTVTDAEGNVTRYAYDAVGRPRVVTDPDSRQVATVYDLAGQALCSWKGGSTWMTNDQPNGVTPASCSWTPSSYTAGTQPLRYVAYSYSLNGKQTQINDANDNITKLAYDGHDRLRFTLYPHPSTGASCTVSSPITGSVAPTCATNQTYERYDSDANGNRTGLRTRKGDLLTYNFDAMSRMSSKVVPGSATVSYAYNLLSEPMTISTPAFNGYTAASVAYNYDGAGRKLFESNNGYPVNYLVDEAGNHTRTTWPDGYYVTYQYDALNRMQYVRENSTTANELAFYDYDTLSRRKSVRYAGQTTNQMSYTYETDSNLDLLTNLLNTTTMTLDYGHNRSGQITTIAANDDFYLPKPASASTSAYVPNKLNQYDSVSGQAATYDLNGNLKSWMAPAPFGKETYTYDAENRLRFVALNGSTTSTIEYGYDPLGRRTWKTVNGVDTSYLYDGDEEIAEVDENFSLLRRYITGPAIDDRVARAEGAAVSNPTKYYYHVNHQGSVIGMTSNVGTLTQQLAYDEYGNLTSQPPAATTGEPFRYTGRRFDPETGLYYYRARYYSPNLGRFLQTDPVGYQDDVNLYAYVGNDPGNKTDSTGQAIDLLVDVGFIGYDLYSLYSDPSWTGVAALGLDVFGAAVPFVTGLGQAYRAGNKLVDVAATAESSVGRTGNAATDGTRIHKEFDKILEGGTVKNVNGETAYLNGQRVDAYRPKGSSNPDAVLGNLNRPTAAFDLKTGKSGISAKQAAKAERNLPSGTPMFEVRAGGHNVPHPSTASRAGAGAAANAVCNQQVAAVNCQ